MIEQKNKYFYKCTISKFMYIKVKEDKHTIWFKCVTYKSKNNNCRVYKKDVKEIKG